MHHPGGKTEPWQCNAIEEVGQATLVCCRAGKHRMVNTDNLKEQPQLLECVRPNEIKGECDEARAWSDERVCKGGKCNCNPYPVESAKMALKMVEAGESPRHFYCKFFEHPPALSESAHALGGNTCDQDRGGVAFQQESPCSREILRR